MADILSRERWVKSFELIWPSVYSSKMFPYFPHFSCHSCNTYFSLSCLTIHFLPRAGLILLAHIYAPIRVYTPNVGAAFYTSVAVCAQRKSAHTPNVTIKVPTCWTFSQSWKRSKVTEGRHIVLHRDICGRIPTHMLACLHFYPRCNLCYGDAQADGSMDICAGCRHIRVRGV